MKLKILTAAIVITVVLVSTSTSAPVASIENNDAIITARKRAGSNTLLPAPAQTQTGEPGTYVDLAASVDKCQRKDCDDCLKKCGGWHKGFSCFYFRCMDSVCKGCRIV
ncbi:hypothetical protein F4802DRAFT_598108 [Xylaria palmicola]|nr:hypothetical protein F4802DRAFT_598108 [Xylaria palmicola]